MSNSGAQPTSLVSDCQTDDNLRSGGAIICNSMGLDGLIWDFKGQVNTVVA